MIIAVSALSLFVFRIYDSQRGPPLEAWHTYVPVELKRSELVHATWTDHLAREQKVFTDVRRELSGKLTPESKTSSNRYFEGSPVNPSNFVHDWNRSFVFHPSRPVRGVAVLFHGLTDSPYSLRHIARHYSDAGFVALAIRLPGHGTVPAGLTKATWEDWAQAANLAVQEGRRLVGDDAPLHLIGYSNGGALALNYALDALENNSITRPDKIILFSPMIGVTRFARFAGVAGLPALFPPFAKAAWLSIVPEFNPFKYNSFPVNAARQSYLLTRMLQDKIRRLSVNGRIRDLAPIQTFQSVADFTVSSLAIVDMLYNHLPINGSELVIFDINRSTRFGPLVSAGAAATFDRVIAPGARDFTNRLVTNASATSLEMVERVTSSGSSTPSERRLGLAYPREVYSLSHIALPFPLSDSLYGMHPDPEENFGVNLGAIATRGERGVLVIGMDTLMRMSSNPFFSYMLERIDAFSELHSQ
ncbi:MAG: alpha/beta hydrolase [Beijerinckiaceae bacterium]|nr:alpha/beta hydrolase [Beijerinckiaceae bacterium]